MRDRYAVTVETAPWKPDGFIARKDMEVALKLAASVMACALPQRWWPRAAGIMARAHLRVRRGPARMLASSALAAERVAAIAHEAVAADYLAEMQAVREALPGGWHAPLHLIGRELLDAALVRSRGAILWHSPFAGSDLAVKKALSLAGYPVTQLSSPYHPYSPTWIGMVLLNPVRLRAINRYVEQRVLVVYGKARPALALLREALARNRVVAITATGAGRSALGYPFLGGRIELAVGAPRLAYETGAALLPVYTLPDGDGYRVVLGTDLRSDAASVTEAVTQMTRAFVSALEPVVREHPAQWQSWFHPGTWRASA